MKKRGLLVLFLAIILISTASAVEIQLSKENYYPGETLQAEIYGNFLQPLELENIHFYRDRNIPMVYDILKLQDKYLFYALLPYQTGNYSLKLQDIRYTTASGSSTQDIIKNFEIQPSNRTVLTIEPGFIVAKKDFSIKVKASKLTDIQAEFKATGQTKTLHLAQGEKKQISFSIQGIDNYTESILTIQDYEIPVVVIPKKADEEIIRETGSFRFNPLEIKATILKNQNFTSKVKLVNLGELDILNITIRENVQDLKIDFSPQNIDLLEQGEQKFISININPENIGNYSGNISAIFGNISTALNIEIKVSKNKSDVEFESPGYIEEKTCFEIGGKICLLNETCNNCEYASDTPCCCVGECLTTQEEDNGGGGWIYGIIIVVLVLAGLGILFYFMKKKQKQKPDQELEKRQKNYEQRMSSKLQPSKETKDSLSKT
jgi:hypothetical protein